MRPKSAPPVAPAGVRPAQARHGTCSGDDAAEQEEEVEDGGAGAEGPSVVRGSGENTEGVSHTVDAALDDDAQLLSYLSARVGAHAASSHTSRGAAPAGVALMPEPRPQPSVTSARVKSGEQRAKPQTASGAVGGARANGVAGCPPQPWVDGVAGIEHDERGLSHALQPSVHANATASGGESGGGVRAAAVSAIDLAEAEPYLASLTEWRLRRQAAAVD